jgi:hypothetical protein
MITCKNVDQLAELCYLFTTMGAQFKADGATLTITMTGGY